MATPNGGEPASIMDIMKRRKRTAEEIKDAELEGVWFNDLDVDEAFDLLRAFRKQQMFFDDYSDDDFIHLSDILYIMSFKKDAPITAEGETSTWCGILLKGKIVVNVKGTQVAVLPQGTIIGDTGFVEGGTRSADCFGAEGGGVIAVVEYEKLDLLHETHPRLAYKLAISLGGSVVYKLRKTMGKVYQKDNEARKGAGVGRRRIFDSRLGFARDASQLHTLTQKEILYLAKLKKVKKPERERKKKEEEYRAKLEKENAGLLSQLKGCRVELKYADKREQDRRHLHAIAAAAASRYERLYSEAVPALKEAKYLVPKQQSQIEELQTQLDESEKARKEKFGGLEERIEIMKNREQHLMETTRNAERDLRMMSIRVKSQSEEEEAKRTALVTQINNLEKSFSRVNVTMEAQEATIAELKTKLADERKSRQRDERTNLVRARWQSAAVRILSRRIHTVRRVAKVHNAWWARLNHVNLLRFKHMDSMIAEWKSRDDEKKKQLIVVNETLSHVETRWQETKKQLAATMFVIMATIFQSIKTRNAYHASRAKVQQSNDKIAALKGEKRAIEESIVKIANAAKEVQREAHANTGEVIRLKAEVRAAEKEVAWKDLEMYKNNIQHKQEKEDVAGRLLQSKGALTTKVLDIESKAKKIYQGNQERLWVLKRLEDIERRWMVLEERFGHLVPEGAGASTFGDFRRRPHTTNLSFGAASMPSLEKHTHTRNPLHKKTGRNRPRKVIPPYYPEKKHLKAQPKFGLGTSLSHSYFENGRQRYIDGLTGFGTSSELPSGQEWPASSTGSSFAKVTSGSVSNGTSSLPTLVVPTSLTDENDRGSPLLEWSIDG